MKKQNKLNYDLLDEIASKFDQLLEFNSDSQKLEFEEMLINNEAIQVIQELLNSHEVVNNQKKLAEKLNISESHISKLFTNKKYVNIKLLAQLQRVFNMRFKIIDRNSLKNTTSFVLKLCINYNNEKQYNPVSSNINVNKNIIPFNSKLN